MPHKKIDRPILPELCHCGCGQMTSGKYNPSIKGYPKFLPNHHQHLWRRPETQRKPAPCTCGCGQMTKGWFNYRTGKYSEYIKGHDANKHRNKGWSRDYPACVNCGTTSVKYASHGLCQNCEYHLRRKNNPKQRTRRHEYFHRYYMDKKRHTDYYFQFCFKCHRAAGIGKHSRRP